MDDNNEVFTTISSDEMHDFGLANASYPTNPTFKSILTIHALLLKSYKQILPQLIRFLQQADLQKSSIFYKWNIKRENIEKAIVRLASSLNFFIFHGFEEKNRLEFEMKLMYFLNAFEDAHFKKDRNALSSIYVEFFNVLVLQLQIGEPSTSMTFHPLVNPNLRSDAIIRHFNGSEDEYIKSYNDILDGNINANHLEMIGTEHEELLPNPQYNYDIEDEDDVMQFNARMKAHPIHPTNIKFGHPQHWINHVQHHHGGDEEKATSSLYRVLEGEGTKEDYKSFRGVMPLHDDAMLQSKFVHSDWDRYVKNMKARNMGSPLDIFDPRNIKYGLTHSSSVDYKKHNKYSDLVDEMKKEENERYSHNNIHSIDDDDTTFGIKAPAFLKPNYFVSTVMGKDLEGQRDLQQKLHEALTKCNSQLKEAKREVRELKKEAPKVSGLYSENTHDNDNTNEFDELLKEEPKTFDGIIPSTLHGKKQTLQRELDTTYEALQHCNDELRRVLAEKKKLLDNRTLETSKSTFGTHLNNHMRVTPYTFNPRSFGKDEKENVYEFKDSLYELYEKHQLSPEKESIIYDDVRHLIEILKEKNDVNLIRTLSNLILLTMYRQKLVMLGEIVEDQMEQDGLLKTNHLPYHDTYYEELHRNQIQNFHNDAGKGEMNNDPAHSRVHDYAYNAEKELEPLGSFYLAEEDEVVDGKIADLKHTKVYEIPEHVEQMSKKDVDDRLLFESTDKGIVKIPKKLNPKRIVDFIINLFHGNENKILLYAKGVIESIKKVINSIYEKAKSNGINLEFVTQKIMSITGIWDNIKGPLKDYAVQAINYIPKLVNLSKVLEVAKEGIWKILQYLSLVVSWLMMYSKKVYNYVVESKVLWNSVLPLLQNAGTYVSSAASSVTKQALPAIQSAGKAVLPAVQSAVKTVIPAAMSVIKGGGGMVASLV